MNREELIKKVIEYFKIISTYVDLKDGSKYFDEEQLEIFEEVWDYYDDFEEASDEQLEDWLEVLEEMEAQI